MAWIGLAAFFAAMGFAGVATTPLFNPFRAPERRRSPWGCWWILAALFLLWVAAWCFFHVPSPDPDANPWDQDTMNVGTTDEGRGSAI